MQTIDERVALVRSFLTMFKPGLELDIVPINDVYGPTSWDPNIQALVVSKETLSGAAASAFVPCLLIITYIDDTNKVGKLRNEKGLPRLETFVIEVISTSEILDTDDPEHLKKAKISSTFIRQWIASREDDK
jgi:pantetheine-phosphate adenylyltransferase